jgi:acyl dehydratase
MAEEEKEQIAEMSEGTITSEGLEEWNKRIGASLRVGNTYNQFVSFESIKRYVNGIGDVNALYRDPAYAKKTRYGALIAPPNWLYSVFPTWVLQGLPGIQAFHSGNDWKFYRPIYVYDTITPKCVFTGYDVKSSAFSGKMVMEYQRALFYNQREELVGETDLYLVRAERSTARKTGKYSSLEVPHPWTKEEADKVDDDVLAEEVRGGTPRYWEDVVVGEELTPVVKGVFGFTDFIAYTVGASPVAIAAHGVMLREYKKHPAWAFRDPETGAWEPVYGVHYLKSAAKAVGVPFCYDAGAERQSWLINLLTNWMGDEGWIKENYAEYRKFVYLSDAVWLKGKVTEKFMDENGEPCVRIETSATNQRGENTMPGYSVVILPSRENGTSPLDSRLPDEKHRGTGQPPKL